MEQPGRKKVVAVVRRRKSTVASPLPRTAETPTVKKRVKEYAIAQLRPHPRQGDLFAPPTAEEIERVADDMARNGLINPVEITPDGLIICGHTRVLAAEQLGWTHIRCWLRDDLAEAGAAAIEQRLIEDNFHRRHLTELGMARCYRRLYELAKRDGRRSTSTRDLRDEIAAALNFGMSGKQLERWVKLLDLPVPLQHALDAKRLTQALGLGIRELSAGEQQEIADRVEKGEDPQWVAREYVAAAEQCDEQRPRVRHTREIGEDLRRASRAFREIDERFEDLADVIANSWRSRFEQIKPVLDRVLDHLPPES